MTNEAEHFLGPDHEALRVVDPEIAQVVDDELGRLRGGLQPIASENLTSPAVLAAPGPTLSNKYAEGYPGRGYYGGCEVVDRAEEIGIDRAKALFGAEHANLQPHSGANANLAVYAAVCQRGYKVLAMSLPDGGHLTHGAEVSFSGKGFEPVPYTVREDDGLTDYDQVRALALSHRPKMIVAGATAYPRLIDFARFRAIATEVARSCGSTRPSRLRVHRHPPRAAHCSPLDVTGEQAEARSGLAGITLNKNAIPSDPQPPLTASGIRVGSPSITTQGVTEGEMGEVAGLIAAAVTADEITEDSKQALADCATRSGNLVSRFPAYAR